MQSTADHMTRDLIDSQFDTGLAIFAFRYSRDACISLSSRWTRAKKPRRCQALLLRRARADCGFRAVRLSPWGSAAEK